MELFIMIDRSPARPTGSQPSFRHGYARQTARISRACRSRPNSWPTCWWPRAQIESDDGFACPADSRFFDIPWITYSRAGHVRVFEEEAPQRPGRGQSDVGGLKMAYAYSRSSKAGSPSSQTPEKCSEVESMAIIGEIRGQKRIVGG